MCERFSLTADLSELFDYFRIDRTMVPYKSRYNITPNQRISVVIAQQEERRLDAFRWGLIPFWAKDAVNAGSENLHEKAAYRRLLSKHRCIIPCSGFYEWEAVGKSKRPVRIRVRGRSVFGIAGMYEIWKSPNGGEFPTCTIITTRANSLVAEYRDSMPAILDERHFAAWLDSGTANGDYLQNLLRPVEAELLEAYRVSPKIAYADAEISEEAEEANLNYPLLKP